jgi:hypothetical protein
MSAMAYMARWPEQIFDGDVHHCLANTACAVDRSPLRRATNLARCLTTSRSARTAGRV